MFFPQLSSHIRWTDFDGLCATKKILPALKPTRDCCVIVERMSGIRFLVPFIKRTCDIPSYYNRMCTIMAVMAEIRSARRFYDYQC